MIENPYEDTDLNNLDQVVEAINERRERRPDRPEPDVSDFPRGPQTVVTHTIGDDGITEHTESVWVARPILRETFLNRGGHDE